MMSARIRFGAVLGLVVSLTVAGCTGGSPSPPATTGGASTIAPGPAPAGLDVAAENAKPGSPGWLLPARAPANHVLAGFADAVSILPGAHFGVYVSATAPTTRIVAIRIGWYAGAKGRIVWRSGPISTHVQAAAVANPTTRAYSAPWGRSTVVDTTGWPEGDYLLRLDGSDGSHFYVPVTLRAATTAGRLVLMNAQLTWEAYNDWGGRSLYDGDGAGFGARSYAVSFDRPYQLGGLGLFMTYEFAVVFTAERLGLPVAYESDVDVATRPALLSGATGLVSMGHDEYWTLPERLAVERARDGGTNLAFLGANVSYWRVRLAGSPNGSNRLVIGYKESGGDPITGATTTARFRDAPYPHPEQLMTGQRYECYPAHAAFVVQQASFFLFAGSGVAPGSAFPGLVGVEIDRPYPIPTTPMPEQVPALSPVTCHGVATHSGFTYYSTPSGAGVVAVGTMNWVHALNGSLRGYGMSASAKSFVTAVTTNILVGLAKPHLGAAHPAVSNLFTLGLSPTNDTGVG